MTALFCVAWALSLVCAMESWQFNLPPRIFIYEVLGLLFLSIFVVVFSRRRIVVKKELRFFILFQGLYLTVVAFSGFKALFFSYGPESISSYFKNLSSESVHVIFFVAFAAYLSNTTASRRLSVLRAYIAGVLCSSLYGIAQMSVYLSFHVDIGAHLWRAISYGLPPVDSVEPAWSVMGVPRGVGFPGIDTAATYAASILPLLLLIAAHRKKWSDAGKASLAAIGLLITMSRTGIIAAAVSLGILAVLQGRRFFGLTRALIAVSIPLSILGFVWSDYVVEIVKFRTAADASRLDLYRGGFRLFSENPIFGVGAGNYVVARLALPRGMYADLNLHNSWLTILVNLGLVGLLLQMVFFAYMIRAAYSRRTALSSAYVASLIGLSIAALFNQVLDSFYFGFFITLLFSMSVLTDDEREDGVLFGI